MQIILVHAANIQYTKDPLKGREVTYNLYENTSIEWYLWIDKEKYNGDAHLAQKIGKLPWKSEVR